MDTIAFVRLILEKKGTLFFNCFEFDIVISEGL